MRRSKRFLRNQKRQELLYRRQSIPTIDIPPTSEQLIPVGDKKIIGFWHICMINKYVDIISEQLDIILKSELYESVEYISAVCSGNINELAKVSELFVQYPKIRIQHTPNIKDYEFPTLEVLKHTADSNPEFFIFYFHTKGVSYPDHQGGKHWRDYMNHYVLKKWRDNVYKLKAGYSTCGVKLVPKGSFPLHYSGNFWWTNGSYVKTLRPIESLNKNNRFDAEMWICSNNPITATLCQTFVDYNTKGEFIPIKERIVVHTLAYNLSSEVKEATRLLYEQNNHDNFEHIIVDLGFPLLEKDKIPQDINKAKLLNSKENLNTALVHGSKFCSVKNEGVSQNWNLAKNQMDIQDNDVLICADPDERPKNKGWLAAIRDVIRHGKNIAWCSLMMKEHLPYMIRHKKINIHGYNVYILNGSLNWAQGGFNGKFLNEIGGVPVPKGAPIYGWIESACEEKMKQKGYVVAILADYFVEHTECSPLYRAWKTDVTSNVKQGQVDFEHWLIQRKAN